MYTNRPQFSQRFEPLDQLHTSRPDSSKLSDLHVYILPRDSWRTKQNLAYNETIIESISVGFIRVTPDILLKDLRNEIRKQCTNEDIPKDYVFLRSVGRALTRVKPYQEQEIKVKHFMPPQAVGPEVFLLEIDEEISEALMQKFDRPNMEYFTPIDSSNLPSLHNLKAQQDIEPSRISQFYPDLSGTKDSTSSLSNYDRLKDYDKMKEEQERLKNRQIYLEKLRKKEMEKLDYQKNKTRINMNAEENYPTDDDYLASRENYLVDDEDNRDKNALTNQNVHYGHGNKDKDKIKIIRENALSIIEDRSEGIPQNVNDPNVDFLQVENSEESLREKIKIVRQKRIEVENLRNDLLKHIKNVNDRISIRRKEARDLWKKKYFSEKKKTPAIENKMNSLLSEIESINSKFFASYETDNNVNSFRNSTVNMKNTDTKIGRLESLKLEEEIFSLKRQIDHAKLKLASDIKLRIQAESETRALKTELLQTKMNLLQMKNSD